MTVMKDSKDIIGHLFVKGHKVTKNIQKVIDITDNLRDQELLKKRTTESCYANEFFPFIKWIDHLELHELKI
jgi:hypothetical protein